MELFLPDFVQSTLNTLHKNGFEAYVVGGCVRDMLMGKVPHDYDVTTAAIPQTVVSLFPRTVATGLQHGTVTVIDEGRPIEVTTFRTESGYADHRRPDSVAFVSSLKEDLARRDFTVNAMAFDCENGIVDPFGGQEDLKNGILRAVGDAETRFTEDALRILRLFRFSAVLGFTCEEETLAAALKKANGLQMISHERIAEELKKAVMGDMTRIAPLTCSGALQFIGIEPKELPQKLNALPRNENLRLFGFLQALCPDMKKTAAALKLSNAVRQYLSEMSALCRLEFEVTTPAVKRLLRDYGATVTDFADYREALFGGGMPLKEVAESVLKSGEPYRLKDLCITGNDLTARGIRGTRVGEVLYELLEAVIENPALNTPEALLKLAEQQP